MSQILVVGSLAYDSISTPAGSVDRTLGGSANYFSLAASQFAPVRVVGVVGDDYREEDLKMLTSRQVDVSGLSKVKGQTFHWKGKYQGDLNEAQTLATELNVFADFNPQLPDLFRSTPYVFLANIDPTLQLRVLDQIRQPKLVGSDTMNYWIHSKLDELKRVLSRVDILLINEGEAELLTQTANAIAAAEKILSMGPEAVVVKRGEYGFVLYTKSDGYFILPAFPIAKVVDPTGAGDTFAGAFFGYLAKQGSALDVQALRRACVYGCLLASFTVEDFGVKRLRNLNFDQIEQRKRVFLQVVLHP